MTHSCGICGISFSRKDAVTRHAKSHAVDRPTFTCDVCQQNFLRRDVLQRHLSNEHRTFKCKVCGETCFTKAEFLRHTRSHSYSWDICGGDFHTKRKIKRHIALHMIRFNRKAKALQKSNKQRAEIAAANLATTAEEERNALNSKMTTVRYPNTEEMSDPLVYLEYLCKTIKEKLKEKLEEIKGLVCYMNLNVEFVKPTEEGETTATQTFRSFNNIFYPHDDLESQVHNSFAKVLEGLLSFQREGSNGTLSAILNLELSFA